MASILDLIAGGGGLFSDRWSPVPQALNSGMFDVGPSPFALALGGSQRINDSPAYSAPFAPALQAMPQNASPAGPQAMPPQMQPASLAPPMPGPMAASQSPQFTDRLLAGLLGFANSGAPIPAIGNLIGGLATGQRTDPTGFEQRMTEGKQQQAVSSQMAIYQAVLARGGTPAEAMAAAVNPKALEIILGQAYPKSEFKTWGPDVNAGFVTPPGLAGRPGISPIQAAGPKPDDIAGMRKEVSALPEIKKYQEAAPIFNSMVKSLNNKSRAADLDFVYGMAKVFDPDSVVREGEMIIVKQAQNLPDAVLGEINRVTAGQGLSDKTRRELLSVAKTRMEQYRSAVDPIVESYRERAMRQKMLPEDVLPKLTDLGATPESAPTPKELKPGAVIVNPATKERRVWDGKKWVPMKPPAQKPQLQL